MYNMDISIFGYKLSLEVLILIGVIYLILVGHTFCGCCNFGLMEGMEVKPENVMMGTQVSPSTTSTTGTSSSTTAPAPADPSTVSKKSANSKNNDKSVEGFVGANTNYGESSSYNLAQDIPINTASWDMPNMTVTPGKPLSPGVKAFLARKPQPIPLPEGQLLMFEDTPFKPECCPNTYSNSMGCACMTGAQYNYLILRGGNNVPYSEY
jgi:hypothetical protein